mgnify:CR=1 FL=1
MKTTNFTILLKTLRANAQLSLRTLGELTGFSATYLKDLEQGNREPSEKVAYALVDAFNLDKNNKRLLFDSIATSTNNLPYDVINFLKDNPEEIAKIISIMEQNTLKR